ncbi:MAG: hypothetical protein MI975_10600 [Cytophagales bacterium]|nr:hypothetical protein [Cytophagales bacterium]
MKYLFAAISSLLIIYLFSSCAGTRRINFDTAYKFSTYNYHKPAPETKSNEKQEPVLQVSLDPNKLDQPDFDLAEIEERVYEKMGLTSLEGDEMNTDELSEKFNVLDKKDKRKFKREIKTELRQFRKEVNNANSSLDVGQINELSELTRWSIIMGSVGLLLLILGAIFTGVLTFFGAIFVVGAAVLFIVDQA